MSSEAKNLEAISNAIKAHNKSCEFPALEVHLNPFEVERLGWDEILGLPIVGNPAVPTGMIRIVCDFHEAPTNKLTEAISQPEPVEIEPVKVPERELVPA